MFQGFVIFLCWMFQGFMIYKCCMFQGFVIFVTMCREALDDYRRYRRDKEANSQKFRKLTRDGMVPVPSSNIKVGDLIVVDKVQSSIMHSLTSMLESLYTCVHQLWKKLFILGVRFTFITIKLTLVTIELTFVSKICSHKIYCLYLIYIVMMIDLISNWGVLMGNFTLASSIHVTTGM